MDAAQAIVDKFVDLIINPAILVVFSLGLLVFIWGLVQFLRALSSGESGKLDEGKQHMLWGVIGMFIMVSAFSIIALLSNTFGLGVNARTGTVNIDKSRLDNIRNSSFGR